MSRKRDEQRRRTVAAGVERALGDKVICATCGATLATYADKCSSPLDRPCEGFEAIEEVRNPIVRRVYGFNQEARS
jgi:hypothetical protein